MRTLCRLAVTLTFLGVAGLRADAPGRVEVAFDHPENFTDVKDDAMGTDKGRDVILHDLSAYLVDRATSYIPAGDVLSVTFTDIDLAGDFEPWRGPEWSNVRVVKSIYPPALKFRWSVREASGKVLRQGSESIRDLSFDLRIPPDSTDPRRYEKAILSDWIHGNLRDLGPAGPGRSQVPP
jgi:hypothetical protein